MRTTSGAVPTPQDVAPDDALLVRRVDEEDVETVLMSVRPFRGDLVGAVTELGRRDEHFLVVFVNQSLGDGDPCRVASVTARRVAELYQSGVLREDCTADDLAGYGVYSVDSLNTGNAEQIVQTALGQLRTVKGAVDTSILGSIEIGEREVHIGKIDLMDLTHEIVTLPLDAI